MTPAEPDALRLVPVEPTPDMIEAFYHAEGPVGPDRIVSWSVATAMARGNVIRHLDDIFANAYRAMLAAALAHPPAQGSESGGEALAKLLEEASDFTERMISQPWACELIERLVAALPQPGPASEGEGA